MHPTIVILVDGRGVTEQSTLAERGNFNKNMIPILRVDNTAAY